MVAAHVAALGGRPADPASMEEHEDAVLAALDAAAGGADFSRPHDDPDPARRVARRILQRLDGMGKWGGYHTEFAHLARGFAGNERALAEAVGEALLAAGPAGREAERRPAPRLPQPAPSRRHPRTDRAWRGAGRSALAIAFGFTMNLLSQVSQKLFTARTLAETGILRPTRPDKALRIANAVRRWGPTPAAGYTRLGRSATPTGRRSSTSSGR